MAFRCAWAFAESRVIGRSTSPLTRLPELASSALGIHRSSSRAPAGEEGEQGQAEESAVAPAESLDLMQNRLPKLKGLRISTATAETRL